MEHPGHRARFRHVSTVLAEDVANLAYGAVAVVGIDVEQDRHSTRPVTFERKLFISSAGKLARAPLDRSLDVVGRHIFGLGGHDSAAQSRVRVRVTATVFRGNADFLDKAGKNLAALGIERALLMLDCGPF